MVMVQRSRRHLLRAAKEQKSRRHLLRAAAAEQAEAEEETGEGCGAGLGDGCEVRGGIRSGQSPVIDDKFIDHTVEKVLDGASIAQRADHEIILEIDEGMC